MSAGDSGNSRLKAQNVWAGYGPALVLDGVSLTLAAGELVGVVGPNGSGKTTLVRVLAGVLRPRAGAVLLDGDALHTLPARQIAQKIAVVPQGAELPELFTGLEIVLQGRTPHLRLLQSEGPRDLALARAALAACDALHLAGRRTDAMSGGERQRLLLARALTQEPAVLLLDEPTTYLDITHQAATLNMVAHRCRTERLAALAVLHDLTLAAQFCDRLVLLHDGRVRADGRADQVLRGDVLESAYGGRVSILRHPENGRPVVVPVAATLEQGGREGRTR